MVCKNVCSLIFTKLLQNRFYAEMNPRVLGSNSISRKSHFEIFMSSKQIQFLCQISTWNFNCEGVGQNLPQLITQDSGRKCAQKILWILFEKCALELSFYSEFSSKFQMEEAEQNLSQLITKEEIDQKFKKWRH